MKKNKIIIISSIIVIAIITLIICVVLLNNKKTIQEKNENYQIELTNKFAENENIKISIDNVSYADEYLILEYTIKAKDENDAFFIENYGDKNEFGFYLDRNIKIDGKLAKVKDDYSDQISYKISDSEAKVYDIIEVKDLPEKFNLEVKFYENDNTIYQDEEIDEENEELEDEYEDDDQDEELDNIDPDEYYENSDERESVLSDEELEEFEDEYTDESEEFEDEILDESEEIEEDNEEVEGYYDGVEEPEEIDEDIEIKTEELGTITTKANKEELIKGVVVKDRSDKYETNNVSIESQKIIKTPFKTFIIVETNITNVDYIDVESGLIGDPFTYKIDVQDKEGNSLNSSQTAQIKITDENETDINDLEIDGDNIPNDLIATIKTIIALEEDIEEIQLQAYYYSYDFPEDNIEEIMQNKEWFKIEDNEYTNTNNNGGEVKINKIEEKDNQLLFYYEKKGFIPSCESIILLRNNTKEFNIFYPDIVKLEGINSNENIVGYNLENNTSYSYTNDFDEDSLGKIEELEFTLLEGLEIEKIGETFSITI